MKLAQHTKTLLGISIGFLLLFWWWGKDWLLFTGITFGLIGFLSNRLAQWIAKVWFLVAHTVGAFNSRLILGMIYFLILTPIALIVRLFRRDPLNLKGFGATFFIDRDHTFSKEDLEDPW